MLLNTHTYYSFKYGTMKVEELLKQTSERGFSTIALTDINNTSACLDFARQANEFNIKPVVGIDFRDGVKQRFVAIAKNNEGFREMNEFLSLHLHAKSPVPKTAPQLPNCYIVYPFNFELKDLKENEFMGVSVKNLKKLPFSPWRNKLDQLVIMQTTSFRHKHDYNAHRLLRAIDNNTLLSKLPKKEQADFENELIVSKAELEEIFNAYPQLIKNTVDLLANCHIDFRFGKNKNRISYTSSKEEDFKLLKKECYAGIAYRYEHPDDEVFDRLAKELQVIYDMNFCSYFLINHDIVRYAQSKGYFYVGRGSGANSLAAYLLKITNVDPIALNLYFERFINPFRKSPPDFDIDFSWTDRDDVTRYIFEHFGYNRVALLGNYIRFEHKSAFREIGKVFGLPDEEITKLQKNPQAAESDQYGKWVVRYSNFIAGFPSHSSIHSSGILISEEPISYFSATNLLPKGFPSTQFDMYISEDAGLHKYDILSQRGLGKIKDALVFIKQNRGIEVDIHNSTLYLNDYRVKQLLKQGQAIGCFYIESPAMRMLLTKLKAEDYKRLVAASSIIRPGVSQSGMMREYIERFQNTARREAAEKALPELYQILEETYGVMVYQEDVLKVAHFFAGLTLDEADVLRRGMSWKFRERVEFGIVKDKFFSNCRQKKYPEHTISEIWRQIESFANYAFAKGHSASYAVESFQALYLKAYYPIEYMTAVLNNGGGFYSTFLYLHEARQHGALLELPCINNSIWLNKVDGKKIYIGFYLLNQMEHDLVQSILDERNQNGTFKNLIDFTRRVSISLDQLSILIRIDAFRFTGKSKKNLLWDAHLLMGSAKKTKPEKTLFETEAKEYKLPVLWEHKLENAFDEMELLGFTLSSPFDLLKHKLPCRNTSLEVIHQVNKHIEIVAMLITRKPTRTRKGEIMSFGTWLDLNGQWIDTVHFPPSLNQFPFRGPGCYHLKGNVMEEYGFITLEVNWMQRMETANWME
ncbi:MAG: DNA polymerase III subunit alpha [Prolixibacteraceae bacterium]